jgi:uncharacterized repeat protein (TIGR01451 family)
MAAALSINDTITGLFNPDGSVDTAGQVNAVGDTINYAVKVSNTGDAPLTGVTVNDPMLGGTLASGVSLAIGANATYTGTYTVTAADINHFSTSSEFEAGVLDSSASAIVSLGIDAQGDLTNVDNPFKVVTMSQFAASFPQNAIVDQKFSVFTDTQTSRASDPANISVLHLTDAQALAGVTAYETSGPFPLFSLLNVNNVATAVSDQTPLVSATASEFISAGGAPSDQDTGEQAALSLAVSSSQPIGAANAGATSFTIAGLDTEDTGTVTFTDVNSHTVAVPVTAGSTSYTANLASLADGTITSSMQVNTDSAGNSFTPVSGNAVMFDQDTGEHVSLTVKAGTNNNASYTVAGLDAADDTGLVTFTDLNHKTLTESVASNGTFTANLSSLSDTGQITSSLAVTDTAGNHFNATGNSVTLPETSEPPTLKIANLSLTVAAGGSTPMGISVSPFDVDDAVSVVIAGLPKFETITAADGHVSASFGGTDIFTAADVASGLTLHSSYAGKGHPVDELVVAAFNATNAEFGVAFPPKIITVTDPPATMSAASSNAVDLIHGATAAASLAPLGQLAALLDQFAAAGFHNGPAAAGQIASLPGMQTGPEHLAFVSSPHHG